MLANRFHAEDLEANRRLELSAAQRRGLQTEVRGAVVILIVCAAMILSAPILPSAVTYVLAFLGLLIGTFVGYFLWRWQRDPARVVYVDGILGRDQKTTYVKQRRNVTHYYGVGGKTVGVDSEAYGAPSRELPVRACYLVSSQNLVNLELLSEDQIAETETKARPL
jgi:hypothetical protein